MVIHLVKVAILYIVYICFVSYPHRGYSLLNDPEYTAQLRNVCSRVCCTLVLKTGLNYQVCTGTFNCNMTKCIVTVSWRQPITTCHFLGSDRFYRAKRLMESVKKTTSRMIFVTKCICNICIISLVYKNKHLYDEKPPRLRILNTVMSTKRRIYGNWQYVV